MLLWSKIEHVKSSIRKIQKFKYLSNNPQLKNTLCENNTYFFNYKTNESHGNAKVYIVT